MRPNRFVPVLICVPLLALAPAGATDPVSDAPGGDAPGASEAHPRYVASGGAIYEWNGAAPQVVPVAAPGDLPAGPGTAALVPYDGGDRLLALRTNPDAANRIRHRLEGLAMGFDLTSTAPALLLQVPFDGEPTAGVVTADGAMAYVLARRLVAGDEASNRYWVHEIDLEAGRLLGSSQLARAPHGIALEPGGRRLFVTLDDRVQSLSTRPVVSSWHYRSPGPNGAVVVRPGASTLCVLRGEEVALFDPAAIAARTDTARHALSDDASAIIRLPFGGLSLEISEDGRLGAVRGPDRVVFVDCQTQALIWPSETPRGLKAAADVRALAFPGAGLDLILALFPGGQVAALQAPGLPEPPAPPEQSVAAPSAALTVPSLSPADSAPVGAAPSGPQQGAPERITPQQITPPEPQPKPGPAPALTTAQPAAPEPVPSAAAVEPPPTGPQHTEPDQPKRQLPEPAPEPAVAPVGHDAEAFLEGRITGATTLAKGVAIYGPNSIIKEYRRVAIGLDGTWRMPLPPPGSYRIIPVGDGSTPIPAAPGFLTVQVTAGEGRAGIDFAIRAVN